MFCSQPPCHYGLLRYNAKFGIFPSETYAENEAHCVLGEICTNRRDIDLPNAGSV